MCQRPHAERLTRASLPPRPLRHCVRRPQALRSAQVNSPTVRSPRPLPRRIHDTIAGRVSLHRMTRQDTSGMTVNTRVMFRITLYYVPCQAISLPRSMALLHLLGGGEGHAPRTLLTATDINRREQVMKEITSIFGLRRIVTLQQSTLLSLHNLFLSMLINLQSPLSTR